MTKTDTAILNAIEFIELFPEWLRHIAEGTFYLLAWGWTCCIAMAVIRETMDEVEYITKPACHRVGFDKWDLFFRALPALVFLTIEAFGYVSS